MPASSPSSAPAIDPQTAAQRGQDLITHIANARGYDGAKALIDQGAALTEKGSAGHSALIWSIIAGTMHITELLIACGAPLEATNQRGQTALFVAAARDDGDTVALLLKHGASLDHEDSTAHTVFEQSPCPEHIRDMLTAEKQRRDEAAARAAHAAAVERNKPLQMSVQEQRTITPVRLRRPGMG